MWHRKQKVVYVSLSDSCCLSSYQWLLLSQELSPDFHIANVLLLFLLSFPSFCCPPDLGLRQIRCRGGRWEGIGEVCNPKSPSLPPTHQTLLLIVLWLGKKRGGGGQGKADPFFCHCTVLFTVAVWRWWDGWWHFENSQGVNAHELQLR